MDAVSSFLHLTNNIPTWLEQLQVLTKYTADKNAEFVMDYKRIVNQLKPSRVKSPSLASIHSDHESAHQIQIDPQSGLSIPPRPDLVDVDPLEAGNRYLYAQIQRKRKATSSMRSGASGPQNFRTKNQVIIYYDSHVQEQFESMVKAVGVARNNLRKGKNALVASRGFALPSLARRPNGISSTPSLDSMRHTAMSRSSPVIPGSKYMLRTRPQEPTSQDELAFAEADKSLESLQALFETSAHQFLRDGDCRVELRMATGTLESVLRLAKSTAESLQDFANREAEKAQHQDVESDAPPSISTSSQTDQSPSLQSHSSFEPVYKLGPTSIHRTLEEMKARGLISPPAVPESTAASMPTVDMAIEVDDGSEGTSIDELDIALFRATNPSRIRPT